MKSSNQEIPQDMPSQFASFANPAAEVSPTPANHANEANRTASNHQDMEAQPTIQEAGQQANASSTVTHDPPPIADDGSNDNRSRTRARIDASVQPNSEQKHISVLAYAENHVKSHIELLHQGIATLLLKHSQAYLSSWHTNSP